MFKVGTRYPLWHVVQTLNLPQHFWCQHLLFIMRKKLRSYQKDALRYCYKEKNPALFMEMGTGKSLVLIRFAHLIFAKKILIVTPFSAIDGWQDELKFDEEPKALELIGTKQKRIKMLDNLSKWNILNKEGYIAIPEICQINWDLLCIDESVILKNPKSKVSQFFVKNFNQVQNKAILTGLPAPETDLNYFQQLQFLNQNILNFKNFYQFRYRCFTTGYYNYKMKASYKSIFTKALSDHCFFLSREDAGLSGKEVEQIRTVSFESTKHIDVYNRLVENFILEYNEVKRKTKFVPVAYILLRQLCSGFINEKLIFKSKVKLLLELLNGELKNQSVIIWCQYTCELLALQNLINNSRPVYGDIPHNKRSLYCKLFNSGKIKRLVCNPECFKYGKDLSVANTAIYFSVPLGLDTLEQTKRRLTRGKRKDFTLYIYLGMKDSIEIDIIKGLQDKKPKSQIMSDIAKRL